MSIYRGGPTTLISAPETREEQQRASGSDTPSPQRNSKAITNLDQVMQGMIPSRHPADLGDLRVTGTVAYGSDPVAGTTKFVLSIHGKQFLMEESREGRHVRLASTDHIRFDKGDGKPTTLPHSRLLDPTPGLLPLEHWSRYTEAGVAVLPETNVVLDGIPCTRFDVDVPLTVKVATLPPARIQVFVRSDQKTIFAIRQPEAQSRVYVPTNIVEYRYGDYKQFDGALLPTTVSRMLGGKVLVTWHIQSLTSHATIQPSDLKF